ncbi:hypothetical protein [Haloarcula onubensis]|uniref:Halobacterial output domain-containing protein n=1 Tax=Haloarcula onubensis TaxID=2950539 RepID=A0ABU2FIW0_9EURY|nr:hypothetical protein [Halomicroarcula sp. S3CR25-11]MDS0280696.1 hypothetical protein [Halomicroarcula sp. S3CR25-11]
MTDNTPTSNQRILLDVIGNIPADWDLDVTYPTLPDVTHRFPSLPELELTTVTGAESHEVAVRAVITENQVFHGYVVTTTYPEPGVLTATCRERRLTSLSHQELRSKGVGVTHHPDVAPGSDTAVSQSLSLSAAASLAGYFVDTLSIEDVPGDEHAPKTVSSADD